MLVLYNTICQKGLQACCSIVDNIQMMKQFRTLHYLNTLYLSYSTHQNLVEVVPILHQEPPTSFRHGNCTVYAPAWTPTGPRWPLDLNLFPACVLSRHFRQFPWLIFVNDRHISQIAVSTVVESDNPCPLFIFLHFLRVVCLIIACILLI